MLNFTGEQTNCIPISDTPSCQFLYCPGQSLRTATTNALGNKNMVAKTIQYNRYYYVLYSTCSEDAINGQDTILTTEIISERSACKYSRAEKTL